MSSQPQYSTQPYYMPASTRLNGRAVAFLVTGLLLAAADAVVSFFTFIVAAYSSDGCPPDTTACSNASQDACAATLVVFGASIVLAVLLAVLGSTQRVSTTVMIAVLVLALCVPVGGELLVIHLLGPTLS